MAQSSGEAPDCLSLSARVCVCVPGLRSLLLNDGRCHQLKLAFYSLRQEGERIKAGLSLAQIPYLPALVPPLCISNLKLTATPHLYQCQGLVPVRPLILL